MRKPKRDEHLAALAARVVQSLEVIEQGARRELSDRGAPTNPTNTVAYGANTMAHGGHRSSVTSVGMAQGSTVEALRLLTIYPFVARVIVGLEGGQTRTYYVARSGGPKPSYLDALDGRLAAYHAPAGRIAEYAPGEEFAFRLPKEGELTGRVLERTRLEPEHSIVGWDGLHDQIETESFAVTLDSLRALIGKDVAQATPDDVVGAIEAIEAQRINIHEGIRRKMIERMSLRDQAILDRYQGEVFRLPLNRRLMLSGPPGTGKTTTLIKRVAHKSRSEEISEEDAELVRAERHEEVFHPGNWVMFTPTELLKLYLREAFNQEGVAAPEQRIRTWTEERRRLARSVFRVLKSETAGRYRLLEEEGQILTKVDAASLMALNDSFAEAFRRQLVESYERHLQGLAKASDAKLVSLAARLRKRAGGSTLEFVRLFDLIDQHDDIGTHEGALEKSTAAALKEQLNGVLNKDRTLLDRLAGALGEKLVEAEREDEDEDDLEGDATPSPPTRDLKAAALRALRSTLAAFAKQSADGKARTKTGTRAKVLSLMGSNRPSADVLRPIGSTLVTLEHLRFLGRTHRNLVERVPVEYNRFRRSALAASGWYRRAAREAINRSHVSGHEVDVMLLLMLRNATRFFTRDNKRALRQGLDLKYALLNSVKGEYVTQVLVDEATDFSPVQLACMKELARPEFCSFFACGDVRQRVTPWGVTALTELEWVGSDIETREVNIGYRQSGQLQALAHDLASREGGPATATQLPSHIVDTHIQPVLGERLAGAKLVDWLCERIREVERALGKLPSIAIFVDGDDRLDPLVNQLRPRLSEYNVDIVACKEGRVVGNENQVRAFDIQHIKGLEFEAVFFVGIDELAARLPELFDRYLYVGVTRAATYLGVTCGGRLPSALETVRKHFSTDGWR